MHGAEDQFYAHIFHCEPSAGPLCKTIEAACKVGPYGYHMFKVTTSCSCGFKKKHQVYQIRLIQVPVYSLTFYMNSSLHIKLNDVHNLHVKFLKVGLL